MDAISYLRLLLDPDRLKVAGLVALGPATVDGLTERSGLRRRQVLATLAPLLDAGIVTSENGRYRLVPDALRELARDLPQPEPPAEAVFAGMTDEEGSILARFFRGPRLVEIPAQHSKRRLVLERLALEFAIGVRYPEQQVNATLRRFHPDYVSLRRYLVDEGFLDRSEGVYWRAGGRV